MHALGRTRFCLILIKTPSRFQGEAIKTKQLWIKWFTMTNVNTSKIPLYKTKSIKESNAKKLKIQGEGVLTANS